MLKGIEIKWIWIISFLFIAANAVFTYFENYWLNLVPLSLVVFLATVISLENVFWLIVFTTPLSINLEKLEFGGIGMFVPTEPLLFLIMLVFIIRLFLRFDYDRKVLYHPLSIAILFHIFWMSIAVFTSERPIVSLKFVIARTWFVITFYFIAIQIFRNKIKIRQYFWLYIVPLTFVIIYTVINHYFHDFEDKPAHFVMRPFFKDHTSYGAILVMYFPILIYLFYHYQKFTYKFYTAALLLIYSTGIIFSYTRAAWLSLACGVVLWIVYKLKIRFRYLFGFAMFTGILLFASWSQIMLSLEKNRKESSSDLAEHIQSISNVSSDASNLERINRWECAYRMFLERPVFGWGPGTYMFEYAPFQHSTSMTIISTNTGRLGNAHSEYIGPLAESGLPGSLAFIVIVCLVFYYGSRLYHRLKPGRDKAMILAVLIGLSTYVVHGFMNNYLDTDKASLPFWGFIAILVAYDVYGKKLIEEPDSH